MLAALVVYIYFPIKMEVTPSKKVKLEEGNLKNEEEYIDSDKIFIEGSTPIDILNDDCLEIIFSYLDMVDLIRIELVSKKWQELSLKSWKNFRTLNTKKDFGKSFRSMHLEHILKRCGRYLTYLDLTVSRGDSANQEIMFRIPYIISRYCKNLMHLGIITYRSKNNWEELDDSVLTNLKSFFIDVRHEGRRCSQKFISNILKRAVNLEKIHLEFSKGIKDPCLLHITDKCTELSLPECILDSGNLSQVLKTVPRLKKLNINGCNILPEVLEPFSNQLKSLNARAMDLDFFSRDQYRFLNFKNLQELLINFNRGVNDEVLDILVSRCPLIEKLNLAGCLSITDNGFLKLGKLEKLLWLDVSITEISDTGLIQFAQMSNQLQEFHCHDCTNLTVKGLLNLVAFCSDLNFLHFEISLEKFFNYLFFQSVLKIVEHRLNRAPLTIHVELNLKDFGVKESRFKYAVLGQVKRLKLTGSNTRSSKYNVCKIKFTSLYDSEEMIDKAKSWYVAKPLK